MSKHINLLKYINSTSELIKYINNIIPPIEYTFHECLKVLNEPNLKINDFYLFKINTIIDYLHDRLNTGHWSNVDINYRYIFTITSFMKAVILLKLKDDCENTLKETLKCIDLGLLLGAPIPDQLELLSNTATYLNQEINVTAVTKSTQKRKLSSSNYVEYNSISGEEIKTLSCPSVELFNKEYFLPEIPVKLIDSMSHWPALKKWSDINYLITIAGNRTVPIEIGSHYADEKWTQKLMTLQDFIKNHFLSDTTSDKLGYLAQHNLFDQIPELRNDIIIPDYCCLSKNYEDSSDPDINAWFGPQNTVSPLHYDPKNNLLTQIFGTKQIILYSPNDSNYLYPHDDKLLQNTSQVNPLNCDINEFPLFRNTKMFKCLLKPGEMVYIPPKWWHHVTAMDKSFSVSFWWN